MSRQCPWCRGRHYSGDRPCPLRPVPVDWPPAEVFAHYEAENDRRALIRDIRARAPIFGISRTPPARFHGLRLAWARLLHAIARLTHIRA